jgi:hypothetical protein
LLGYNVGEVRVNCELPLVEKASFSEVLNEQVDAVVAILGLSDHVASEVTHLVGILCEASWKGGFVATRWDQMNVLSSLSQLEDWLIKLPILQCNLVFLLHVFS